MSKDDSIDRLLSQCVECGMCQDQCFLLQESGQSPLAMARRGITLEEARSCFFCGACETACPQSLSPSALFLARRQEGILAGEIIDSEYIYMLPDRKNHLAKAYRSYYQVDYSDISYRENCGEKRCFFPGCTLMTYSSALTREIWRQLQAQGSPAGLWEECCGKLLVQVGLNDRVEQFHQRLRDFVKRNEIQEVIAACPGCYYELRDVFAGMGVTVKTVYEVLTFWRRDDDKKLYTIHDSCPDRQEGVFAKQVRNALRANGFRCAEMLHHGQETICCGSGGQVSHFRPERVAELVQQRQQEAAALQADTILAYCLSCVLKYDTALATVPVMHVLALLLGVDEDYHGGKNRLETMFSNSDGKARWEQLFADEGDNKHDK